MVSVLCGIARTKLVALWIGAAGVGLFSIFNGAVDLIGSLTLLGIRSSAVRELSAVGSDAIRRRLIGVVRRWGLWLGCLGAVVMVIASWLLSKETFGDFSHSWQFCALAIVLLTGGYVAARQAIMQGTGQLGRLAKSTAWGVVVGLAVCVPLLWYFRADGILPSVIGYGLALFVATWWFDKRGMEAESPDLETTFSMGKGFLTLGFFMVVADFMSQLSSYAFTAYLNVTAGDVEVGFYRSGFTLFNRYVGMVFAAIATEYYPRLASVSGSSWRTQVYVAHETGVVVWLLMPLVVLFAAVAPVVIRLLYSAEFLPIVPFVTVAMFGTVLRGVSWCMAFEILARGDGRIYVLTETVSAVVCFGLNVAGYRLMGLTGLGYSYVVWYAFYTLMVWMVYRWRYGLWLSRGSVCAVMATGVMSGCGCWVALCCGRAVTWIYAGVCVVAAVCVLWRLFSVKRKGVKG